MNFSMDQILQPNTSTASHPSTAQTAPNFHHVHRPQVDQTVGRYIWVPGSQHTESFAHQYTPPAGPSTASQYAPPVPSQYIPSLGSQYAPPVPSQYAPPIASQYAPPVAPQYGPPNLQHEGSVSFSLEQVICLMKQGAFSNFRGRRRRRGSSPYYNDNRNRR